MGSASSILLPFKVLAAAGYVPEYLWAHDAVTVAQWLGTRGPVVMGTNWFETMEDPVKGWLRMRPEINPAIIGGHSWILIGVDTERPAPDGSKGAAYMQNSWGRSWGNKGRAWISLVDLDALIKADGEACTAREIKPLPVKR